jgi:hypothetical protein
MALGNQQAKFWCGQNFAQRNPIFQGAEISLKRAYLVLEYRQIICPICILFL